MSTRQVASLLAVAAPEVLPPRDTLRATAPDRYTLKVSIDQECEQGLRLLKDLMSHVDPRMSWGDLVARLVREAVARHDPRGGGRGQRRKGADSAGASPRRAPKETRAAGAASGPAQRVGEASGRAPNRTGAAGAAAGPAQRVDKSSGRAPNRTRAAVAPVVPARRTGGATPAPPGNTAATERQNPIGVLANAAPPSQSAPAAPLDGARAGGVPSSAHAATSAPQSAHAARLDGARAGDAPSGTPAATAHRSRRYSWMAPVRLRSRTPATTSTAVGARGTVGWRPRWWRSIGHVRRYFGAAVGARGTVGWRPRWWRSIGRVRRYFGAAVGTRGTVGWRPRWWRSIGHVRCYFGAAVGARGTVGWRPHRRSSIGRARHYFGAAVGARAAVGWRPRRRRSIGRIRRYFGAAVGARGTVGWRPRRWRSIGRARRYFGAAVGARAAVGWRPRRRRSIGRIRLLLRRRSRRTRHCWMAPAQVALHRALHAATSEPHSACPLAALLDGASAQVALGGHLPAQVCRAHRRTSAPEPALGASPGGGPSGAPDGAAGGASAAGFSARASVPGWPVATAAAKSVLGGLPDGGPPDASAGAAAHTTREPVHSRHQSHATAPHSRGGPAPRLATRRWTLLLS